MTWLAHTKAQALECSRIGMNNIKVHSTSKVEVIEKQNIIASRHEGSDWRMTQKEEESVPMVVVCGEIDFRHQPLPEPPPWD